MTETAILIKLNHFCRVCVSVCLSFSLSKWLAYSVREVIPSFLK